MLIFSGTTESTACGGVPPKWLAPQSRRRVGVLLTVHGTVGSRESDARIREYLMRFGYIRTVSSATRVGVGSEPFS